MPRSSAESTVRESGAVLRRYETLATDMARRHGPRSQAVVFVRYEELLAVRALLLLDRDDRLLTTRAADLSLLLQRLYRDSTPLDATAHTPWRRVLRSSPPLIEFDRERFRRQYARASPAVLARTVTVGDPVTPLSRLRSRACYMYVVTDKHELRVWAREFPLQDLIFGRNRATVDGTPVAHPMLVPENLRVEAAGEIVFIGRSRIEMVVANTKSGHYRPPPESGDVLRSVCVRNLGVAAADVDVFTLFPDDSSIGAP